MTPCNRTPSVGKIEKQLQFKTFLTNLKKLNFLQTNFFIANIEIKKNNEGAENLILYRRIFVRSVFVRVVFNFSSSNTSLKRAW